MLDTLSRILFFLPKKKTSREQIRENIEKYDSHKPEYIDPLDEDDFKVAQAQFQAAMDESKKEPAIQINAVLKEPTFDGSGIVEYKGEGIKTFEFRPTTWEQFIGQEEAKERAKIILKKADRGMKAHFLVDGIKGHGKTTFVELVGKSLEAHIIKRIGKQINEDNIIEIINEINSCESDRVLFFVDEIDTMEWKVVKILNPIIESFEIEGKKIKPFIFAGATINKHILIEKNPDTLDRIPLHIKFKRYNAGEISIILNQYWKQLYSDTNLKPDLLVTISKNCKFNPRTAIGLLEESLVEDEVKKVLKNARIVKDGLTDIDIKILKTLKNSKRAMGANAIAMKLGLSEREYLREFEPFLIEYGYVNRVPSRIITDKGKELLEGLSCSI